MRPPNIGEQHDTASERKACIHPEVFATAAGTVNANANDDRNANANVGWNTTAAMRGQTYDKNQSQRECLPA
jgi:hypothetical protein